MGQKKHMHRNYWAHALEPTNYSYWSLCASEPVLHNKRSHHNEKPVHPNKEETPLATTREKSEHSNKHLVQPKIN